ncbi:nonstructural protein [Antarctic picorna-like virus 4]|uniref:nonstructural protein n=1 Tax=Antarctic picorna-like virus 4 TaxID=1648484 RepID=UPI00067A4693|nr:nonstructural protein [Antarctic picorna-like virus 4]AKG93965.1 nonstructural protein [Antarctic picorna-like virus 4]
MYTFRTRLREDLTSPPRSANSFTAPNIPGATLCQRSMDYMSSDDDGFTLVTKRRHMKKTYFTKQNSQALVQFEDQDTCIDDKELLRQDFSKKKHFAVLSKEARFISEQTSQWYSVKKSINARFRKKYSPQAGFTDTLTQDMRSGMEAVLPQCLNEVASLLLNKIDVIISTIYIVISTEDQILVQVAAIHNMMRALYPKETDIGELIALFKTILSPITPQSGDEDTCETKGKTICEGIKECLSNWRLLRNHKMARNISLLLSACVAVGLCGPGKFKFSIGDLTLFSTSISDKQISAASCIDAVLETITFFFEGGLECMRTQSLYPLLFTADNGVALAQEVAWLKSHAGSCANGMLFRVTKVPESTYMSRLEKCRDDLLGAAKSIGPGFERRVLEGYYSELTKAHTEIGARQAACNPRRRPFAVKVFHQPLMVRQLFCNLLATVILMTNGFDPDDTKKITMSDVDKYDSTLKGYTEAIIDDDVGNTLPKFAQALPSTRIINLVNNKPYSANMAAVEDKGKVAANPKVYIMSTNVEHLHAYETSACPSSILGRCDFNIHLKINPMFRKEGREGLLPQQGLDAGKVLEYERLHGYDVETFNLTDIWLITVCRAIVVPPSQPTHADQTVFEPFEFRGKPTKDMNIVDFLQFTAEFTKVYFANQNAIMEKTRNIAAKMPKCKHGYPQFLDCPDCIQDLTMPELSSGGGEELISEVDSTSVLSDFPIVEPPSIIDCVPHAGAIGFTTGLIFRSWMNGTFLNLQSWVTSEALAFETMTSNALVDYTKTLRNEFAENYISYMPESLMVSPIGRFCVDRAVKAKTTRIINVSRFLCTGATGIICYTARKNMFGLLFLPVPFTAYQIVRQATYEVCVRSIVARRDGLEGLALRIRETYIARAVAVVGIVGLAYSAVAFLKGMAHAGSLTDLNVWRPFGTKQSDVCSSTHVVVTPEGVPIASATVPSTKSIWKKLTPSFEVVPENFDSLGKELIETGKEHLEEIEVSPHGNLASMTLEDIEKRNKEPNPYKTVVRTVIKADCRTRTYSESELQGLVARQLNAFAVDQGDHWSTSNALCLTSRIVLLPKHMLYEGQNTITGNMRSSYRVRFTRRDAKTVGGQYVTNLYAVDVEPVKGTDLVVAYVPAVGDQRDILHLFPEGGEYAGPAMLLHKGSTGDVSFSAAHLRPSPMVSHSHHTPFKGGYSVVDSETFPGLCLGPYCTRGKSKVIAGLHIGGKNGTKDGIYASVDRSTLEKTIESLLHRKKIDFVVQSGTFPVTIMGHPVLASGEVHRKCPSMFQLAEYGNIDILGPCFGRSTAKSTIVNSVLSESVAKWMDVPQKWGPPSIHPWKHENQAVANYCNSAMSLPSDALDWALDDWVQPILQKIDSIKGFKSSVRVLTEMEAVSGIDGQKWFGAINKQAAVGYPATGPKSDFLLALDPDDYNCNCPYVLGPEAAAEKERLLMCYDASERAYPIFKTCPKDEALPLAKDKKRLFQAGPLGLAILVTEYFGPIFAVLSKLTLTTECSIGINCASQEWSQMINHLKQFPTSNTIAGDYKNYDQKLGLDVTDRAWRGMIMIAKHCGYSDRDIKRMYGISADLLNPVIAFQGTMMLIRSTTVSGTKGTGEGNGSSGSLLLRAAYYTYWKEKFPGKTPPPFRKHVALQVYGDDNVATTDLLGYNMEYISSYLGKYDYVYTMAQKDSAIVPFVNLDTMEYLKRKDVFHPALGCSVGALNEDSIYKSLHTYNTRACTSRLEHACDVLDGASREFFLHGKAVYDDRIVKLRAVAKDHDIVLPILFKEYEDHVHDWKESYSENT